MMPVGLISCTSRICEVRCGQLDAEQGYHHPSGPSTACPSLLGVVDILQWSAHVVRCLTAADHSSTQDVEDLCRAHMHVHETCGRRRSDKGRAARLKLGAQALKGLLVRRPESPKRPRVALGMPILSCCERAGNRFRQRSAIDLLRPKCFALLELIRLWQYLWMISDVEFSLQIASVVGM
jgi:hypothetical protein